MRARIWLSRLGIGAIVAIGFALVPAGASAGATTTVRGTAADGSQFVMEKPDPWNGTLVLYSHGYEFSFTRTLPPIDAPPGTRDWLLGNGYALAASSYSTTGWALQQAFVDQIGVLDMFKAQFGAPKRTIAWGHSLGGMITAGLVQLNPDRFTAALPMCGVVAGGPGVWNQGLDSEFALQTLMPTPGLKLVRFSSIADANANFNLATAALAAAQKTPAGQARIALAAALADVPGWFDPTSPEPAPTDFAAREVNQFNWDNHPDFFFGFFGRFELEVRAGGNVSWNTGVDYRVQLSHSADFAEVKGLYAAAGLDLNADLDTLNAAPRISADPAAVAYLTKFITYNGSLAMPVLTLHTTGDGLVEVTDENAYASVVRSAGDNRMLRETFVHRAGHCTFTPAETISAFQTLVHRVNTGRWENSTSPDTMNANASALGAPFNIAPPSFVDFKPDQFLRPFDARDVMG